MTDIPKVYTAIAAVTADLSVEGISKDRNNQQQGYKFRGIDDVYNALSPILSRHKLCMLPRVLSREVVERTTQKGNALFYVTVDVEFDLVSAEDASKHTIRTFGEAMDSADKATNKAMSAAYKYAAMQAFAIPTEGDNDADAITHDVKPTEKTLVKDQRVIWGELRDEIDACQSVEQLGTLWASRMFQGEMKKLKDDWQKLLVEHKDAHKVILTERPPVTARVAPNFEGMPEAQQ
jgi:hypothetical protein